MKKKTKYIIGGTTLGVLALIVIYINFFTGNSVDHKAAEANTKAAEAIAAESAKRPAPPAPPTPTEVPRNMRGPHSNP